MYTFSLFLIKHSVMETYGGRKLYLHTFITSTPDGGESPASPLGRFTPGKEPPVSISWDQNKSGHWRRKALVTDENKTPVFDHSARSQYTFTETVAVKCNLAALSIEISQPRHIIINL
jgi:hypothetical protein